MLLWGPIPSEKPLFIQSKVVLVFGSQPVVSAKLYIHAWLPCCTRNHVECDCSKNAILSCHVFGSDDTWWLQGSLPNECWQNYVSLCQVPILVYYFQHCKVRSSLGQRQYYLLCIFLLTEINLRYHVIIIIINN